MIWDAFNDTKLIYGIRAQEKKPLHALKTKQNKIECGQQFKLRQSERHYTQLEIETTHISASWIAHNVVQKHRHTELVFWL